MTAQIQDCVVYQDEGYALIGIKGEGLPEPADFGMTPTEMHTACYRGYYCAYKITDDQLFLDMMTVQEESDRYLPVNGALPNTDRGMGHYESINLPVKFSGILRLGRDFLKDLYVHMGFQKSSSFATVLDLRFEVGQLTTIVDRSAEMARIRGQFCKRYGQDSSFKFIEDAFSLDLDNK